MRPGNCSGSYSEPPKARAIALRSSSCPREVDATTFSIRNLAMGTPPWLALRKPARLEATGVRRCLIWFRPPADPPGDLNGPFARLGAGRRPAGSGGTDPSLDPLTGIPRRPPFTVSGQRPHGRLLQ